MTSATRDIDILSDVIAAASKAATRCESIEVRRTLQESIDRLGSVADETRKAVQTFEKTKIDKALDDLVKKNPSLNREALEEAVGEARRAARRDGEDKEIVITVRRDGSIDADDSDDHAVDGDPNGESGGEDEIFERIVTVENKLDTIIDAITKVDWNGGASGEGDREENPFEHLEPEDFRSINVQKSGSMVVTLKRGDHGRAIELPRHQSGHGCALTRDGQV